VKTRRCWRAAAELLRATRSRPNQAEFSKKIIFFDPAAPQVGFFAYQKYNQNLKNEKTPEFGRDLVARGSLGRGRTRIKIVPVLGTKNCCWGAKRPNARSNFNKFRIVDLCWILAVIHEHQGAEAILSRKCHSWKDCCLC